MAVLLVRAGVLQGLRAGESDKKCGESGENCGEAVRAAKSAGESRRAVMLYHSEALNIFQSGTFCYLSAHDPQLA